MKRVDGTFRARVVCELALVFVLSMTLGCSRNKNSANRNDPILQAYRLIDEQRDDEAIALLENKLIDEPDNVEFKNVLASAYAHKAGIRVQKLVPVLTQADRLRELNETLPEVGMAETLSGKVNAGAFNMATLFSRLSGFFAAYAAIPLIEKDRAVYLRHAIDLLTEIGPRMKPEDALYRAVLSIVLFKHIMIENLVGAVSNSQKVDESSCFVNISPVNSAIVELGELLIDIFNDIGFSQPSQAEAMRRMSQQTSYTVSDFTVAITSVTVYDQAANIYLKQAVIQNGFGKLLKCGGN